MDRQTIIFIGHDATRTGAPRSLLRIVEWFRTNSNYSCCVILNNDGPLLDEYAKYAEVYLWNYRNQVNCSKFNQLISLFRRIKQINNYLTKRRRDRILKILSTRKIKCIFNNTGVNGHILEILKPALNAPIISRIPELEAYTRKNNQNGSFDKILANSDHFIAVSASVKCNLMCRHSVSPDQISIVHGTCGAQRVAGGMARVRKRLGIPDNAFLIGGCGTMDWRKGIDLFIQIANCTAKHFDGKNIFFCWIGSSISQNTFIEYQYEIELLSLNGRLFFLGEVPDTTPYMAEMDIFLLTSREDPFPLVMLEAARQGVPIICFEGSGGAMEFLDENTGKIVPMLDVVGMTQALIELQKDSRLRKKMGEAAYEKSLTYTSEKMGKTIYDIILNVAKR